MFSVEYCTEIERRFRERMELLERRILRLTGGCDIHLSGTCEEESSEEPERKCAGEALCREESVRSESVNGNRNPDEEDLRRLRCLSGRLLAEKRDEICETLAQCAEEEAQALTFLYGAMPLSDLLDYPAALFLAYARHGVLLWKQGPFAGRVPEELFANYVLHHRVNNEDIADTRRFFYDRIKEEISACANAGDTQVAGKVGSAKGAEGTEAAERVFGIKGVENPCGIAGDKGADMYSAAIEINYWCAGEATYRATDNRTQNPRTVYHTAIGRCGEESTFTVTALRSMGIPARQVYAPLWSHCDDNHAWVEVWCEGKWYFLGACEPEERLNLGWFNLPASRAMLVHSKRFGAGEPAGSSVEPAVNIPVEAGADTVVGTAGMAKVLNHLERYARTVPLTVRVLDENGHPVPCAKVDFRVLNQGSFGSIATLYTGSGEADSGEVRFVTGLGDLFITVSARSGVGGEDFLYGEKLVSLARAGKGEEAWRKARCEIALGHRPECWDGWRDLELCAPEPCPAEEEYLPFKAGGDAGCTPTAQSEIREPFLDCAPRRSRIREQRLASAAEMRRKKEEGFYDEEAARRVLGRYEGRERAQLEEILRSARGNMAAVVSFIEWDASEWVPGDWRSEDRGQRGAESWKLEALKTLREKDYWDLDPEVLKDCCIHALPHAGSVPDDIFFPFLLCPRVADEMLRPCRGILRDFLGEHIMQSVRETPERLLEIVDAWILSLPEQEYGNLVISPQGCLSGGIAGELSEDVFCVNAYRALGVPARRSSFDGEIEYYRGGEFIPVSKHCSSRADISAMESHILPAAERLNSAGKRRWEDGSLCAREPGGGLSAERTDALRADRDKKHSSARLTLCESAALKLSHWERYSLERFEGGGFRRLRPDGRLEEARDGALELCLKPGCYRVITVNRKQNGNQLAKMATFVLEKGERRKLTLSAREISPEDMSRRVKVSDFELQTLDGNRDGNRPENSWTISGEGDGNRALMSTLAGDGKALFLWLEAAREPTEHILNELCDRSGDYRVLSAPMYVVLRNAEDLKNPTLRRTMKALPALRPLLGDFSQIYEKLAEDLGQERGKLPLVMIVDGGRECIYSDAGYNVGQADILWKFLK